MNCPFFIIIIFIKKIPCVNGTVDQQFYLQEIYFVSIWFLKVYTYTVYTLGCLLLRGVFTRPGIF